MPRLSSRKDCGLRLGGGRDRDDLRAVNEASRVVAENSHLGHRSLKFLDHRVVISCMETLALNTSSVVQQDTLMKDCHSHAVLRMINV